MTPTTAEHAIVRLERIIPAQPHKVYRAWLEPDLLRSWLAPSGSQVKRVEVEEQPGGHFRVFWHADAGSDVGGFDCELIELVPDQRLVFRWGFVGPERNEGPTYDSLLTITLREAPGGVTALTLVHERLEELAAAMPHVAKHVETEWNTALEKLITTIGAGAT